MEEEFFEIPIFLEEENFIELNVEENKSFQHSKDTSNIIHPIKKRELTYDDILGSMNLKVVDGQLQYIQQQKVANPVKKVKFSGQLENEKSQYLDHIPRSKEEHQKMIQEHQKMMQEHIKKQIETRMRQKKSTKLLFTNHLPQPLMPNVTSSTHFLQFVKSKMPMRPLR